MTEIVHITYSPQEQDIITNLSEEADLLRDGHSGASDDELADLLGEAAEEIERLRGINLVRAGDIGLLLSAITAVEFVDDEVCPWCHGICRHRPGCLRQNVLSRVIEAS